MLVSVLHQQLPEPVGQGGREVAREFEFTGATPLFTLGTARSWVPASGCAREFMQRSQNTTGSLLLTSQGRSALSCAEAALLLEGNL